ncbi:hypothetical protein SKAU_G00420260 [Synaphobranchus kaupii]|uniref:Uncharacterized protein n=1 Tax=Synaphobranchus kaupii TaxID=118154 RepID=A0A9Q1E6P3_SYNKA|nr:hypothetical protein SKAU_G00420260 [Synaphobranchus kaupii]
MLSFVTASPHSSMVRKSDLDPTKRSALPKGLHLTATPERLAAVTSSSSLRGMAPQCFVGEGKRENVLCGR